MSEFGWEEDEGDVQTTSRLRVWWLTKVQGYTVIREKLEPQPTLFSDVQLKPRWFLSAPVYSEEE